MVFRDNIPSPSARADEEMVAITVLLQRSNALRNRLLAVTIALSFPGGAAAAWLYVATADLIYGRVIGLCFAAGALVAFLSLRRAADALARTREDRWVAELARARSVDPEALADAVAMLRPAVPDPSAIPPREAPAGLRRRRSFRRGRG